MRREEQQDRAIRAELHNRDGGGALVKEWEEAKVADKYRKRAELCQWQTGRLERAEQLAATERAAQLGSGQVMAGLNGLHESGRGVIPNKLQRAMDGKLARGEWTQLQYDAARLALNNQWEQVPPPSSIEHRMLGCNRMQSDRASDAIGCNPSWDCKRIRSIRARVDRSDCKPLLYCARVVSNPSHRPQLDRIAKDREGDDRATSPSDRAGMGRREEARRWVRGNCRCWHHHAAPSRVVTSSASRAISRDNAVMPRHLVG
jgi:hypothetical protein